MAARRARAPRAAAERGLRGDLLAEWRLRERAPRQPARGFHPARRRGAAPRRDYGSQRAPPPRAALQPAGRCSSLPRPRAASRESESEGGPAEWRREEMSAHREGRAAMASRGTGAERRSVLPPIIFEKDRRFLESVQRYILTETEKVRCVKQGPPEEHYIIYRNAFDKIIEYVTTYKNVLISIKQEYEAFIDTVKKGQNSAFFLHGRLKVLASEPTTLLYYRKRAMELEDKINAIEKSSAKIQNLILRIKSIEKIPPKDTQEKTMSSAKPIPGLSLEESLNLDSLSKYLAQLDRKVLELKKEREIKHVPWKKKIELEQELLHLLTLRDIAEAKREKLKLRIGALHSVGCIQERNNLLMKYFEALINSTTAAGLPQVSTMTLDAVKYALAEKQLNIVMHWVTQQRLMFSEALGDVLYDHGKVDPSNLSKCLALAQIVYDQSGVHKKVALCLYKQGQIYTAVDYIRQLEHFSLDDYLFLLENCTATEFTYHLSEEWFRNPPLSSLGSTVLALLSTDHRKHGFQLLEEMSKKNTLEQMILNDTICTVEDWKKIADSCAENKHEELSQQIISVITSQDGVFESSAHEDEKDAVLMEHVFW
ncbi:clathrin heavy chain linker domain-containing protein 1 [Eudromia elegans]